MEVVDGIGACGGTMHVVDTREQVVIKQEPSNSGVDTAVFEPVAPSSSVAEEPVRRIDPDGLKRALFPTLERLYRQDPESLPFRMPVDPQGLGIPDYFDIVKEPMDLSTIKKKLETGVYSDPWQYVDDVWLMFQNAWLYNREQSKVYKFATKVRIFFTEKIKIKV